MTPPMTPQKTLWFDLRRPSDTFGQRAQNCSMLLWFDLRRPSDTLHLLPFTRCCCCGSISGAPQIHFIPPIFPTRLAVVRSQAPLRYILLIVCPFLPWLWFDLRRPSDTLSLVGELVCPTLWFDLRRPSDTLVFFYSGATAGCGSISGAPQIHCAAAYVYAVRAVVRSQAPLRYIWEQIPTCPGRLWFDLRRPSDTFMRGSSPPSECCGSISGAPQIHSQRVLALLRSCCGSISGAPQIHSFIAFSLAAFCCGSISGAPQIHSRCVHLDAHLAVVRSQAPLRYISTSLTTTVTALWFDLRRPSDTLRRSAQRCRTKLWFDLRRPSDTLSKVMVPPALGCGSISGAPQIHSKAAMLLIGLAVVRSRAPLRYICVKAWRVHHQAVVRSQAPLRYIPNI